MTRSLLSWLVFGAVGISSASEWTAEYHQSRAALTAVSEQDEWLRNQQQRSLKKSNDLSEEIRQNMEAEMLAKDQQIAELKSALNEIDAVMNVESAKKSALQQLFAEQAKVMQKKREEMDARKDHHIQVLSESLRSVNDQISDATQSRDALKNELNELSAQLLDEFELEKKLTELTKNNDELQSKNRDLNEHSSVDGLKIQDLISKIECNTVNLAKSEQHNADLDADVTRLMGLLPRQNAMEVRLLEKMESQSRSKITREQTTMLDSLKDLQMHDLTETLQSLMKKSEVSQKKQNTLQTQLCKLKAQLSDNDGLERELAALQQSNAELNKNHASLLEESVLHASEVGCLSERIGESAKGISESSLIKSDLQSEIDSMRMHTSKLSRQLQSLSEDVKYQQASQITQDIKQRSIIGCNTVPVIQRAVQNMAQAQRDQQWQPLMDSSDATQKHLAYQAAERFTQFVVKGNNLPQQTDEVKLKLFERMIRKSGISEPLFFDSRDPSMKGLSDDVNKLGQLMDAKNQGFVLSLNTDLNSNDQDAELTSMQVCIDNQIPHPKLDDVRKKLAIAHGLEDNWEQIQITGVFKGSLCFKYTVCDLVGKAWETVKTNMPRAVEKLKRLFPQFKAAKLHPLLYRPKFDMNNFDNEGDKEFNTADSFWIGPSGLKERYIQPRGWTRYGLKVLGKYESDTWLKPFVEDNLWWKAYHGTSQSTKHNVHSMDAIHEIACVSGFIPSQNGRQLQCGQSAAVYGDGVYCATSPERAYIAQETLQLKSGLRTFQYVMMCAVRPSHFGVHKIDEHWWVVKDKNDIRPYGILVRECTPF